MGSGFRYYFARRRLTLAATVAGVITLFGVSSALADGFRPSEDLATSGNPTYVQVTTGPTGESMAVWVHGNGSYNAIFARRIAADGTLGPIIPDLSDGPRDASNPQAAIDSYGNATVTWGWQDTGSSEIAQTRQIAADGTLGPIQNLSPSVGATVSPQVVIDQDGVSTFVFRQAGNGGDTIFTRRMSADGVLDAAAQQLASPGIGEHGHLAIDSQGRVTAVWAFTSAGSRTVQSIRIAADGTLGTPQNLTALTSGFPSLPRVAVARDGSATVAWTRSITAADSPVQVVRIAPDGTAGNVTNITVPSADASDVRVGVDSNDNSTLTWISTGSGFVRTAKVARLSADGTLGTIFDLATPSAGGNTPDVAVAPSGVATMTWVQQNSGDMAQARSMSAGGVLGTKYDLSAVGGGAESPKVAGDPRGNAIVTWAYNGTSAQTALSKRGFLRAVSSLSPVSDTGLFDLQLGGENYAENEGNGGNTGLWAFPSGTPTPVSETAVAPTSLSDYTTTITCQDNDGAGSQVASAQDAGPLDITLEDTEEVSCDVANTRIVPQPPTTAGPETTAGSASSPTTTASSSSTSSMLLAPRLSLTPPGADGNGCVRKTPGRKTFSVQYTLAGGSARINVVLYRRDRARDLRRSCKRGPKGTERTKLKMVRMWSFESAAGKKSFKIPLRTLRAGRYTIETIATDASNQRSILVGTKVLIVPAK